MNKQTNMQKKKKMNTVVTMYIVTVALLVFVQCCSGYASTDDSFVMTNAQDIMRAARQRAMTATSRATDQALKAAAECKKAEKNAKDAKTHTQETQNLLKELVGESITLSRTLQQANEAAENAVAALEQCLKAMNAATTAENAAAEALFKVMEAAKNINKDTPLTQETQKLLDEHAQNAIQEVEKAEAEAANAENAAKETMEAAASAFRAQDTANEIAEVVNAISQKIREQGDKQLATEKTKTQQALQRAIDAEAQARLANEKLVNAEIRNKEKRTPNTSNVHQVRVATSIKDGVGRSVCGHALLMLMLFLPTFVFAAVP